MATTTNQLPIAPKRLVYRMGKRAKKGYCYEVNPKIGPKKEGKLGKMAHGAAKMTSGATKATGKMAKRAGFIWPIKFFLGILDILAAPYGSMRGKDINFPLLWKAGAIMLIVDVWIFLLIGKFGAKFLAEQTFGPSHVIVGLLQTLIPGALGIGALSLIIGGIRLQQGKSFLVKYGAELEPLPAFESGVIFRIGDLKLSLRDMHTNIGAFGGIGTGKCLHPEQDILMYDGTIKKVKDVQKGNWLMGPDGKPRTVIVTSTGFGPLYRIVPTEISKKSWICNDVHVMSLLETEDANIPYDQKIPYGPYTTIDIDLDKYLSWDNPKKENLHLFQVNPYTQDITSFGWNAVPIGKGPYCGFTLDGDGRFLLGDFTVTHNTVAVMIPLMRQFFQQLNHDTDDPDDEHQKVAALILDEKGDFIDSTIMEMLLAGRPISDLVLIDPDLDLFRYNPLDPSQSCDENAEKLGKVQKILGGGGGGGDNKYWDDTSKSTIKFFLQLLEVYKPKEKIGLDDIARFMRDDQLATILCDTVERKIEEKKESNEINEETYGMIYDAISNTRTQWIELSANTKSILKTTINQMLSSLASNPRLQKVFCRDTNFSFKDLPNKGKIVLFRGSGIDKSTAKLICVCLKIDFQTWQKRRNGSAASAYGLNTTRTVLFICDEYQEFVTCGDEGDQTFYGVSRSARTCAIVATQSLNSLKSVISKQEQANTLIQNITTWVFLRTTDKDTMELGALWAGQSKKEDYSQSQNTGGFLEVASNMSGGSGKDSSVSISRKLEEVFRKDDFSKLITMTMEKSRTGPWYSEAIVYHYHDTDSEAESRCYKTKLTHYYYSNALRKKAGENVSNLDNLLYDRNWQRKTLQRALVMIARESGNSANAKKEFLEKMAIAGRGGPTINPAEAKRARLLESAIEKMDADNEIAGDRTRGKKLQGEIQEAKELTKKDLEAIKLKRQKLITDHSNATNEEERREIEREIGRLNHMQTFSQLMALSRSNTRPGTVTKEVLEANKNILDLSEPEEETSEETTETTENTGTTEDDNSWFPGQGEELEEVISQLEGNICQPYEEDGRDEEDDESVKIRQLLQKDTEDNETENTPNNLFTPTEEEEEIPNTPEENKNDILVISTTDSDPPEDPYGEEEMETQEGPDIPEMADNENQNDEDPEDDGDDDSKIRYL